MTITEFRRRCTNRTRRVRVADTWKFVEVSARVAENLFYDLRGAVEVDVDDYGYAYIAAAEPGAEA